MPNWCYTQYVAEGPKDQLQKLHNKMKELYDMPSPGLEKNGFGSNWLGNLVIALGEDWNTIRCRGTYCNFQLCDEVLTFDTETAWCEMSEVRHLIEQKFPGVKLYYISEEIGCGIFMSNDKEQAYFHDRFYFSTDNWDGDNYISSLDVLIETVEQVTGCANLKTVEDCIKAANEYEDSDGFGATLMVLEYFDD